MKILITDDETPARNELSYILQELEPTLNLIEAKNGEEALKILSSSLVDVVFLDINMPGMSGLSVAASVMLLPDPPLVVFATAYDEHAVRAFELEALDYIVKPFDERRIAQTFTRIQDALNSKEESAKQQENMRNYLNKKQSSTLNKLWAERENENRVLLDFSDIIWLEAEEKKVYAYTFTEKLLVRYTLKELEEQLDKNSFARVHKASIINLNHIAEVVPWFSGNYMIRMNNRDKTEVKMSRRYAVQVKELTGWR